MDHPLRLGIFLAPFHPSGQNPTAALHRDVKLIQPMDDLGYDEVWVGEHFLFLGNEGANPEATHRSYDFFARYEPVAQAQRMTEKHEAERAARRR